MILKSSCLENKLLGWKKNPTAGQILLIIKYVQKGKFLCINDR